MSKEVITTNEKGGMKAHTGKLRYGLLKYLYGVVDLIVGVLTFGAQKYDDHNWRDVGKEYYIDAGGRHVSKWMQGERNDKDSGIHHLAHAITNYMFVLWHELKEELSPKEKEVKKPSLWQKIKTIFK
jgi:hypothetical protein